MLIETVQAGYLRSFLMIRLYRDIDSLFDIGLILSVYNFSFIKQRYIISTTKRVVGVRWKFLLKRHSIFQVS